MVEGTRVPDSVPVRVFHSAAVLDRARGQQPDKGTEGCLDWPGWSCPCVRIYRPAIDCRRVEPAAAGGRAPDKVSEKQNHASLLHVLCF